MGFGCFFRSLFPPYSKKEKRHRDAWRYPEQESTIKESDDEQKEQIQTHSMMKLNEITNTLPHSTKYQEEDELRGISKQPSATQKGVACKITVFKYQKPPEVKHSSLKNQPQSIFQPLFNDNYSNLIFEISENQFVRTISQRERIAIQSFKLQSSDTARKQPTHLREVISSSFQENKVPGTSKLAKQQQQLDKPCHSDSENGKLVQNLTANQQNAHKLSLMGEDTLNTYQGSRMIDHRTKVSNEQLFNSQAQSSSQDERLKHSIQLIENQNQQIIDKQPYPERTMKNNSRVNPSNQLDYPKPVLTGQQQNLRQVGRRKPEQEQTYPEPVSARKQQKPIKLCTISDSSLQQLQLNQPSKADLCQVERRKSEQEHRMQRPPSNCGARITESKSTALQIQEQAAVNEGKSYYKHQGIVPPNNEYSDQQLYTEYSDSDQQLHTERTIRNNSLVNPLNQLDYPEPVSSGQQQKQVKSCTRFNSSPHQLQLNQLTEANLGQVGRRKPEQKLTMQRQPSNCGARVTESESTALQIQEQAAGNESNKYCEHQRKEPPDNQYSDQQLYRESSDPGQQLHTERTIRNNSRVNPSNQLDDPKPVTAGQQQQPIKSCTRFNSSPQKLQLNQLTAADLRQVGLQKPEQELTMQCQPSNCGARVTESESTAIQEQAAVNESNKYYEHQHQQLYTDCSDSDQQLHTEITISNNSRVNRSNQLDYPESVSAGQQQKPIKLCTIFDSSLQQLQLNQPTKTDLCQVERRKSEQEHTMQRPPSNCGASVTESKSTALQIQEQAAVNEGKRYYEHQRKVPPNNQYSDQQLHTERTTRNNSRVNRSNQLDDPEPVSSGQQQKQVKSCTRFNSLPHQLQLNQLTEANLGQAGRRKPEQELTMQCQPSNCGARVTESESTAIQEQAAINECNKIYYEHQHQQLYTDCSDSDQQLHSEITISNNSRVNRSNELDYPESVSVGQQQKPIKLCTIFDSSLQQLQLNQPTKADLCQGERRKPEQEYTMQRQQSNCGARVTESESTEFHIQEQAAVNEDKKYDEHQRQVPANKPYSVQELYTESSDSDQRIHTESTIRNTSRVNPSNQLNYPKPVSAGQQQKPIKLCTRFDRSPQQLQQSQLTKTDLCQVERRKPQQELTKQRQPSNCGTRVTESTAFQIQEQAAVNEDKKYYEHQRQVHTDYPYSGQQLYTEFSDSDQQLHTERTIRNTSRVNPSNQLDYPKPVTVGQQFDISTQELQLNQLADAYLSRMECQKAEPEFALQRQSANCGAEVTELSGFQIQEQPAVNEVNKNCEQHKVPLINQYHDQQLNTEYSDLDQQNLGASEHKTTVPEPAIEITEDFEEAMELETGDSESTFYDEVYTVQPYINEYQWKQIEIANLRYFCKSFETMIAEFVGSAQSDEYYFINESLTRAVLKLDRLNVENNVKLKLSRKRAIKYIYDLFDALEKKIPAFRCEESILIEKPPFGWPISQQNWQILELENNK